MILPALLTLIGVVAIALATPRQAAALFGPAASPSRRRRLRVAGFALLACGFAALFPGGDHSRRIIGWIGIAGVEACMVALAMAVLTARRPHNS